MPPAIVPEAYPPMPLVTNHSRDSASSRLPQTSRPNCIVTVMFQRLNHLVTGKSRALASRISAAGALLLTTLLDQLCYQPCPSRLVTRADACAVVPMKTFVKQDQVLPMRIVVENLRATGHWPPAVLAAHENPDQPPRDFARHLPQIRFAAGMRRALHFEILAVIVMKLLECLDKQIIHGKPDRPAPV